MGAARDGRLWNSQIPVAVEGETMGGEIFNTAILLFTLTLVGMGVGFVMLRIQGGEE
jgi:cytochrome b6-f complex subunit 7